ncbi:flagellar hook-basal body complex protein FliE [Bartonella sp. DGB2]|uniref:flagellar hook-basal body complex protein FliE n=1 Tax=Bartonella sp. DGB2 TaxID=3388426 RepID=UPI00398F93CC
MIYPLTAQAGLTLNRLEPLKGVMGGPQSGGAESPSFDEVLTRVGESFGAPLHKAETISMAKMAGGDVAVRDVVNSVMEAERALNIAIAIRDKIVQAYTEVSRMQI